MTRIRIAAALFALALPANAGAAASGPLVDQMVVFKDGSAKVEKVRASATSVRIRGRRCAVGRGTALAALVRSRVARLRLLDFRSCSDRAADGAGLFVNAIGPDRNTGQEGWVYKVGQRLATAGAADPAGAFGRGGLRRGARVTWFYCRLRAAACQPTLVVSPEPDAGGTILTRVREYDDEGRSKAAAGATVSAGGATATTGADGVARLATGPGRHEVAAERDGTVRAFPVSVTVP